MPKLSGIKEKYINDIKVDKENAEVFFNDAVHKYYNKNDMQEYTSVTSIIHLYSQEFDEDFWSAYKALEAILDEDTFKIIKKALLTTKKFNPKIIRKLKIDDQEFLEKQQEIRLEYKRKRDEACERGTKIHAEFENSFYGKDQFDFNKFGYKELDGQYECRKDYYILDIENGVYPEFLISRISKDGFLKVAGQIDLLVKKGNDIYIIDWKTNSEIKQKSFYNKSSKKYEMMKYPLNNLMDCNFVHYTLQLSLYAYLLQQINPEYNIRGLKLVHIDHDGLQHEYECEYLKEDVERMLKHYKKQIKIKAELADLEKRI